MASLQEAAAIAAAIQRFLHETAPAPVAVETAINPSLRASPNGVDEPRPAEPVPLGLVTRGWARTRPQCAA
jgi:hypothetical protein